jgi:cytochrome c5
LVIVGLLANLFCQPKVPFLAYCFSIKRPEIIKMPRTTIFAMLLFVSSCSQDPTVFPRVSDADKQSAMEKWQRSCALCHVDGNGGAPRVGDHEAWQSRIAQPSAVLLEHMQKGFGGMPPLGYCMDCSEQDFLVLTAFMAGEGP